MKAATQQCCVLRSSCLKAREPPEHPCRRIQQRQCGGSLGGSDSNCTGATQAGHTTTPGPSNVPVTRLSTPDGPTPAHRSERSAGQRQRDKRHCVRIIQKRQDHRQTTTVAMKFQSRSWIGSIGPSSTARALSHTCKKKLESDAFRTRTANNKYYVNPIHNLAKYNVSLNLKENQRQCSQPEFSPV